MTDHTLITNYYIAHRDELLAYAVSRLGDSCQAEDIVQNVFLRLEQTTEESILSAREVIEQMERGLARLPENCREIYRLHIYNGMKVSEISQQLGEGYKSVEHRLGTARKAMRHYLRKYA